MINHIRGVILIKKIIIVLFIIILVFLLIVFGINFYIKASTSKNIYEVKKFNDYYDAILVLGCGVTNGKVSPMLKDRLDSAIKLYKNGSAKKLLMSGDHGRNNYDEVNTMKKYAIDEGVPSSDIFMDHAGFSTYDSIYRAKNIYGINKMIIVTQKYHLYRALYIASKLGIEAYGVEADNIPYRFINIKNEIREVLARDKDFFKVIFKPQSKYMGEPIDIHSSGEITFD